MKANSKSLIIDEIFDEEDVHVRTGKLTKTRINQTTHHDKGKPVMRQRRYNFETVHNNHAMSVLRELEQV
jgi:hypothetical protein